MMTNNTNNANGNNTKVTKTVRISTKKSILIKYGLLQFFSLLVVAIAIVVVAIIFTHNKAEAAEPVTETKTEIQYVDRVIEKPVETIIEKPVEVIKEVVVEKPVEVEVIKEVEVEKEVIIEKPVEVIKEVTVETIVEKPVEVEVVKEVEVEKVVEVVDQEASEKLAKEMAQQMFAVLKETYIAQADEEATKAAVEAKYTELANTYMAQADAEETLRLATEMAQEMLEQYKAEYIEAQEVARVNNVSSIFVHIYGGVNESNSFYIEVQGSLYDRLTYAKIYEVLQADARFEGYKVNRIANKDAVEVFVGEDYTSTRSIRIELK